MYQTKPSLRCIQPGSLGYILAGSLMILLSLNLPAQEDFIEAPTPVMHERRDYTISFGPHYANHPNAYPRIAGAVNTMAFLGNHVSLNANMAAGQGYFHFGTGIIGVPAILLAGEEAVWLGMGSEGWWMWMLLVGLAFENINFHIPIGSHFEISPYFSLLRIKYIEEGYGGANSDWNANLVGGLRLHIFTSDRFFLAPYAEVSRDWGHGPEGILGISGGMRAGFYFRRN